MSSPADADALAPVFARQMAEQATAALDVRDGKRRWLFYFEGGALVSTRSNLKSEHLDTIREQKPDLDGDKLLAFQAIRRVKNALNSGQAPRVVDGAAPKERAPVDAALVLVRGLQSALDDDALEALAGELLDQELVVTGDWAAAGASRRLAHAWSKHGAGPVAGSALVDAAGKRRTEALAALWLAGQLGLAAPPDDDGSDEADDAPALGGLDLSGLIAGTMESVEDDGASDAEPAAAQPAASPFAPSAAPFAPSQAAPAVSIDYGDDDDDDSFDDDDDSFDGDGGFDGPSVAAPPPQVGGHPSPLGLDPGAPSAEQAIQIEAVTADTPVETTTSGFSFPSFQQTAAAAPEPAADAPETAELRLLIERIQMAESHFDVLDVVWDAPVEDFRVAHRDLARKLHPDAQGALPDALVEAATESFDKVREAWEVLSDDESRQAYIDKVVHGKKTEEELAMEQVEAYWSAEADFKRGLALFHNGRVSQAHDCFAAAVDKVPDELEFKAYWAFTSFQKVKSEDPEKAEEYKDLLKDVLDKNQQQERKLDTAWVLMGKVYRDLGNDKAAKRCFVQALKLNAANGDANRELRRLTGASPGGSSSKGGGDKKKGGDEKKGFFGRFFGGKK